MSQRDTEEGMQRIGDRGKLYPSSRTSNPLNAPQRLPGRLSALKKLNGKIAGAIALMGGCAIAFSGHSALAQSNIVPDATLGAEGSVVVPNFNGLPVEAIGGGAVRGQNLFHSFQEFNISDGRGAYFFSPNAVIQNILARVTGNNPSEILGTLGTFGNSQPNLLLMNPNGIIFGSNGRLNVGGSFVASTANSLLFDNDLTFSTADPKAPPLLTISVPLGLGYGRNSGRIQVKGAGLQVPNGRTLALLGGDVILERGSLRVAGGRVELGGLSEPGIVRLNTDSNPLSFGFPDGVARADVALTDGSGVIVGAGGGGSIAINAQTINILGNSRLIAGIAQGLGSVDSKAGDIEINATGSINISESSGIGNQVVGIGSGGDISITANSLSVTNGASLSTSTFRSGKAGNIRIKASHVSFDGLGSDGRSTAAFSSVASGASGEGGDIEMIIDSLDVTNGAQLVVSVSTGGQGNAGRVKITANDTVRFDGVGNSLFSSGAFSSVRMDAVGEGGEIEITTRLLEVTNGAALFTSTGGQGNAGRVKITASDTVRFDGVGGDGLSSGAFSSVGTEAVGTGGEIEITTRLLEVTNGGQLGVSTRGQGNAGDVRITASDTVRLDGVGSNGFSSAANSTVEGGAVGNGGNIAISTESLFLTNGAYLSTTSAGQGQAGIVRVTASDTVYLNGYGSNGQRSGAFSKAEGVASQGGDIEIYARLLSLTDAVISTESTGTGTAGDITIQTRQNLELDRSNISATTQADDGGNIRLQVGDLLLLRNDSNISSTAGVAGAGGDGGNININAAFVVAVPVEDSDITANAFNGRGGNINITTQGIYGLTFRERDIPDSSDITASSQFGLDGEFQLDLLTNVDPSRGLAQLPTNVVDASQQIDRRCSPAAADQRSSFVITGRGGLPPSPNEVLQGESVITPDWVTLNSEADNISRVTSPINSTRTVKPLVEAQSWVYGANGEVILTTQAPGVTPHNTWSTSPFCEAVRKGEVFLTHRKAE